MHVLTIEITKCLAGQIITCTLQMSPKIVDTMKAILSRFILEDVFRIRVKEGLDKVRSISLEDRGKDTIQQEIRL